MHVEQVVTQRKKVTHVLSIGEKTIYCTSARHVCAVLKENGIHATLPIVYRYCSKNVDRQYQYECKHFPEHVVLKRYEDSLQDATDGSPSVDADSGTIGTTQIVDE